MGPTLSRGSGRRAPVGGAATERPQPGRQLRERERLDQVVVGTRVETGDTVTHGVAGREHQDGDLALVAPESLGDLQSADVRQADVQDDHVDGIAGGAGNGVARPRPFAQVSTT